MLELDNKSRSSDGKPVYRSVLGGDVKNKYIYIHKYNVYWIIYWINKMFKILNTYYI